MNLIEALSDLTRSVGPHIIAIDGPAGAGKTTLADEIKRSLPGRISIIHLDDIYDGWLNALGPSLTERLSRIVEGHFSQEKFEVDIYDWSQARYSSRRTMEPVEILILDGVGSAQPVVREKSIATIWINIDSEIGIERVLIRDGDGIRDEMKAWQIAQEDHFAISKAADLADFVITSG